MDKIIRLGLRGMSIKIMRIVINNKNGYKPNEMTRNDKITQRYETLFLLEVFPRIMKKKNLSILAQLPTPKQNNIDKMFKGCIMF